MVRKIEGMTDTIAEESGVRSSAQVANQREETAIEEIIRLRSHVFAPRFWQDFEFFRGHLRLAHMVCGTGGRHLRFSFWHGKP